LLVGAAGFHQDRRRMLRISLCLLLVAVGFTLLFGPAVCSMATARSRTFVSQSIAGGSSRMMSLICGGFCALATCITRPIWAAGLPFLWLERFNWR